MKEVIIPGSCFIGLRHMSGPGCSTRCTERWQRLFLPIVRHHKVSWAEWPTVWESIQQALKPTAKQKSHFYSGFTILALVWGFLGFFLLGKIFPALTGQFSECQGAPLGSFPSDLTSKKDWKSKSLKIYEMIEAVSWSFVTPAQSFSAALLLCHWEGNCIKMNQRGSSSDWIWKLETLQFSRQMRPAQTHQKSSIICPRERGFTDLWSLPHCRAFTVTECSHRRGKGVNFISFFPQEWVCIQLLQSACPLYSSCTGPELPELWAN